MMIASLAWKKQHGLTTKQIITMAELTTKSANSSEGNARRTNLKSGKVDLTAMVDLAFLLITFFMLTTSLSKSNSLMVSMPDRGVITEPIEIADTRTVHVILGEKGKVMWYYGKSEAPITAPALTHHGSNGIREVLLEMKKRIPQNNNGKDMIVLIKPTDESIAQDVVSMLDEMAVLDIHRFMLTKPSAEERIFLSTF